MNGQSLPAVEAALKGENPFSFRLAQAQIDPDSVPTPSVRVNGPTERTLDEIVSLEPSFMAHEAVTGIPFVASHFKMDKAFAALSSQEQAPFLRIEKYLKGQISSGKYQDSAEAARSLIKKLESKLYLNEHHDPFYKAERMRNYLDVAAQHASQETLKPRVVKEQPKPATVPAAPPPLPKAVPDKSARQIAKMAREAADLRLEVEREKLRADRLKQRLRGQKERRELVAQLLGKF